MVTPLMTVRCSQDVHNRSLSRVLGDSTTLLAADGSSGSTTAIYRMDLSAGEALVGGALLDQAALTDTILLGVGTWGNSYNLLGGVPVALSAVGKTCMYVLVAVPISNVPTLCAVFGAEADDGDELIPTEDEIIAALRAGIGKEYNYKFGLILDVVKVQRTGGGMVLTAVDPATNDILRNQRLAGTLNP